MPRRRRHRRNRRKIHKQQQNQNVENLQSANNNEICIQETPKKSNSDAFVTLPDLSPLSTPNANSSMRKSANLNVLRCRSHSLVNTTPTNTKRNNKEINATNLSKLFNVEDVQERHNIYLNNVTPKRSRNIRTETYIDNLNTSVSAANILVNQKLKSIKIRSNSSISKLHSPGLDKIPIMVDVATQTVYFHNNIEKKKSSCDESSDIHLQNCMNIFETPKINQMKKLESIFDLDTPLSRVFQSNFSKVDDIDVLQKSNRKDFNKLQNIKYLQNLNDAFLPSMYISPKIMQKEYRQSDSDAEVSFSSSQVKRSSTPIEKLQKTENIIENMAKNILNAHLDHKQLTKGNERMASYLYNLSTPKTPNDKNINSKFEDKVYSQKINKLNCCVNKRRIYNSVSPRKLKDISAKLCNNSRNNSDIRVQSSKNDSNIVPKSYSPQRISFSKSNNFLNMSNSNIYARFMTNVKKLHNRYSGKWLQRITDICSSLGITIRKRLSSMFSSTTVNAKEMTVRDETCYNCKVFKDQIVTLMKKVVSLEKEHNEDKEKVVNLRDEITNLSNEIGKIKGELIEFDVVKKKIQDLEQKLEKRLMQLPTTPSPVLSRPLPPAPPIPPPPPPLPSTPVALPTIVRNFKANRRTSDKKNCENSRPVISLNDILSVKLKKTSDKPPIARRVTQPIISVEMLNQIKLKPTSRPQTPSSTVDLSSPTSLSSSPATSLTRILSSVDPNVRRLKRLRRLSRYSLDDSRKQLLRRERTGEDI